MSNTTTIGFPLFPNFQQLDLTGPHDVLAALPDTEVFLISKDLQPVQSSNGLAIMPNMSLADCPNLDVICVPGGSGIMNAIEDKELLDFIRQQGHQAKYVTAVCTGSLVLAAAGLLKGYKATTHWLSLHLLEIFGVDVVRERVVRDRNRITGGGVTAGIDFGLSMAAELTNEEAAKRVQLMIEYNPAPPFACGSPEVAGEALVEQARASYKEILADRAERLRKYV